MLRPWRMRLDIQIDQKSQTPLYLQIVHGIIHEIERGRLESGEFLASSREMALALGVNRKTVVLAYEDLIAQGWLISEGTSGTKVSDAIPVRTVSASQRNVSAGDDGSVPLYDYAAPPERSLAISGKGGTKLDEGSPDGRLFPADVLSRAYRSAILRASRHDHLSYSDPRGSSFLREEIAKMLTSERGLVVSADNICITRGSQNGIFLAAKTLLKPGDVVLVEDLTYEPALEAFRSCGAHIVSVKLDELGVDVEDVERKCREYDVKMIFLTPHHQFPTTVSLSPERRLQIIHLANHYRFAILEDDYDHEFHFHSQPLLPMASYAPQNVVYVGSLSKMALPALRVGYVAAPVSFVDALAHQVSISDGMGNILTEDAAALLMSEGELRRHARKAARAYAARREFFATSIQTLFGEHVTFRMPAGGLAFWVRFPDMRILDRIERNATREGLRFAPSHSYSVTGKACDGLRLGFGSRTEKEARKALEMLAKAADLPAI
ncbi:aminotransferase-like domain-containing protein [Novacetimonas pomaceti]|uniref:aminotransferase-like domain-containing protein n=1 Tax=Novacetimonas pomaceti TaxID=2021998 RepID=UPI001C2D35D9|nr:PLP-dependent aminotransferase family protein [Novacetimonas pomaceti]MBV1834357.1 PLP-dependent aminotransferase family protein [Novacetimonas pomaceti]